VAEQPSDIVAQRVEVALRRFQESWAFRELDPPALSHDLDALDAAVELWLDVQEAKQADESSTS
jgi:hypothetical protein